MDLRERIYKLIEPRNKDTYASRMYDIVMLIAIVLGIFPLMFRAHYKLFWYFDLVSSICFIIDYILRWCTADYESKRGKIAAFVIYTFRVFRVSRMLKILRVFKVIRYFEPLEIIMAVIRKQSKVLMTVLSLAIFYIFITALIMFNAEEEINPETGEYLFEGFFDAFYWAACTLTTVGYGDIYPISHTGRVISIISSMVGIAIIALPSGIITAGYMDELEKRKESEIE